MRTLFYGRYSTGKQRAASIDDQLRNCVTRCEREGWPRPLEFADRAISGARTDRPQYQRLLAEARRGDVILVDDLSRFGRDKDEISHAVKRLVFNGVRLIGVSDGVDTQRESYKVDVGLRGLMSELYRDELASKTHRGLTGRALAGASAGGLPYGYRITAKGEREIDESQAQIVRRIFAEYLGGRSARQIAAALNRERIPSARGGTWALSAIHGDQRRGLGILANPIYCGRQIWNRSQWIKHPENPKGRIRRERPEHEWIVTEHPELAIVEPATFGAVQARLQQRKIVNTGGANPRHLLSGLLRCGRCGGPMVVVDSHSYGCASAKDRGTCAGVRVPRKNAEAALLAGIKQNLLTEDAFQQFQRDVLAEMKREAPDPAAARAALANAERVRENIMAALRAGIITPSTRAELMAAEQAVAEATQALAAIRRDTTVHMLPRAREIWRAMVQRLEDVREVPEAREAIREMIGTASVVQEGPDIFAELGECQIALVAGARSVRYLTAPSRVLLYRSTARRV